MRLPITSVLAACLFPLFLANAHATLIINEVDYDQPGTDTAEFIELYNAGNGPLALYDYHLDLINGSTGSVYHSIALPSFSLLAHDYYVVCTDALTVLSCDLDVSKDTNLIQNGAPDAIALFMRTTLVDVLSYEGDTRGFVEASGSGLIDNGSLSFMGLSRWPSGRDSDNNSRDFIFSCITPGSANTALSTGCTAPTLASVPAPASLGLLLAGLLAIRRLKPRLS